MSSENEIVVFCEGKTEVNTLNELKKQGFISFGAFNTAPSQEFAKKVAYFMGPQIQQQIPVRLISLRDLDAGKTMDDVVGSTEGGIRKAIQRTEFKGKRIKLSPHRDFPNVFILEMDKPNLRIALQVSVDRNLPGFPPFTKHTTDDYVLDLSMREQTIENLPEYKEAKEENPTLSCVEIREKILNEIYRLLKRNGFHFKEAKDFVDLYIATLRLGHGITYANLPGKVIHHANDHDVKEVFESWIAAFHFVAGGKG